ncbi:MAG: DNA replication/repair protein RecF [Fimbriimonas sp.]|nr:DNA replication/repair protein RecF [Fimbriimonas sp.]
MTNTNSLNTVGEKERTGRNLEVASVHLEGFRNYENETVRLGKGFNVLAGQNAQGKTNFLEAIYLVSTTRLLRGQRDSDAILQGATRAHVTVELDGSETKLSVVLEAGIRKRASINGLGLPRAADLIGRLPCVCVSSADMAIVRGEPADRRLFLDLELSALYPGYLRHLTHYKRALEQRNALLRDSREWMQPPEMYEPWEDQLSIHGSALRRARAEFVTQLEPFAIESHEKIGGGETIALCIEPKDPAIEPDELRNALVSSRHADVARGGSSVGPHRDDLGIKVGGRDGRSFGSQGQQRTAVISIKLAALGVIRRELGIPALLLLDDILSDLDESRRSLLVDAVLEKAGQAVLTCTEASSAGKRILEYARVFQVDDGRVTER